MLQSFRGYLDEIKSEKLKPSNFHILFFLHVQCGVRVALPISSPNS